MASLNSLPVAGKIAFGVFGCTILAAAFYFLVYSDLVDKVAKERAHTQQLELEEREQKEAQAKYLLDRDELAVRETKQRDMNKMLPMTAEAAGFISTVQQVSNVAGIDLKAWQPQDEVPQGFFAKVPMKLEITGKFHQLAKFMYEIGRTDRIINVENIELFEAVTAGDEVNLKARCLATTFHLIAPTPATGTGTAPVAPVASGGGK